jgi:outer membrane protein
MWYGFRTGLRASVRQGKNRERRNAVLCAAVAFLALSPMSGRAETMSGALSLAYQGNPDLNQQRAGVRAADENIPRATAAYRPQVSATGTFGPSYLEERIPGLTQRFRNTPGTTQLTITETLFNGGRNTNGVKQAESNLFSIRETLRETEQTTLLNGSTAYMNVLRDTAILDLRKNNIIVLEEQLRQTRDRFTVGEVTVTDVAQADASLASARSDYFAAQSSLATSVAVYRQVIGVQPTRLQPARSIEALLPRNVADAVNIAFSEHPVIQSALHAVDAAALQVKLVEGELYPTLGIVGTVSNAYQFDGLTGEDAFQAQVMASLSVPIYTGGEVDARARQSKELLTQARIQADLQRDAVRALVVSNWGQLEATKAAIKSNESAVKAAEIALAGIREEAKVGQRTTFDVLTAQQTLLNARVSLVTAQRDRVVASYQVMSSIGRLSATSLSLNVVQYDPTIHFDAVKDKWIGLRTPDGR